MAVPAGRFDVLTDDDARSLAHRLLTPGRRWPVAVVTVANGAAEPFADVDALVADLRGLAEVVVMPTSDVSWAFSSVMPQLTQVYGGASRVYPVDHEWVSAPRKAPLRFAYSVRERERVTDQLVADAMSAAVAAGLYQPRSSAASRPSAEGTVVGLLGSRALIRLDDGSMATLWEELTGFDVPLDRLVQVGQRVRGTIDAEARRLDPAPPADQVTATPAEYRVGAPVLAEVVEVAQAALTLRIAPGADVLTPAALVTTNELDSISVLFSPGDVVVARLTALEPAVALSLLDVDDDETPVAAPAILDGGPPWLVVPAPLAVAVPLEEPVPSVEDPVSLADDEASAQPAAVPEPAWPQASIGPTPLDVVAGRARKPAPDVPGDGVARPPRATDGPAVRDLSLSLATERARSADLRRQLDQALGASHELRGLRQHAEQLERELSVAESNVRAFRDKYRRADLRRQQLEAAAKSAAGRRLGQDDDVRDWFADPADALRFSVTQAWARRVPPGEKARWPLGVWAIGGRFVDSLDALGPVSWRKLAEVVADVVVAEPARLSALEHHELRIAESGGSRATTREDGAVCYRVALQQNSPSARRLHYWRRGDYVELSRVVLHDDTAP